MAGLCTLTGLRGLHAGEANATLEKSILENAPGEPFGGRVHGLVQLDISSAYITPRGLNVENQGGVFQHLILIFWNLYNKPDAFLNDVTLTTGLWNSIHTVQSGVEPGNWNEIDAIGGLTLLSAQLKVSTPLSFIPKGYWAWTLYAGVKYYALENAGLFDGNQVRADATREKDLFQFSGGIAVFI